MLPRAILRNNLLLFNPIASIYFLDAKISGAYEEKIRSIEFVTKKLTLNLGSLLKSSGF